MKKTLFPIFVTLASLFLMVSCQSDEPLFEPDGGGNEPVSEVNKWIEATYRNSYLWDVANNPDLSLSPENFFNSLKNPADNVSVIWKTQDATNTATYTIGFEYGINEYEDNNVYYVILYTLPNSDAARKGLERGYLISHVNNVAVSEANAKTLLEKAYADGGDVDLTYVIPGVNMDAKTVTVMSSVAVEEDPIYVSQVISLSNNNKIGYIVYNGFTPGKNFEYDDKLAAQFTRFVNEGVDNLVIDLRYNAGGVISSAAVLGSAAVANRVVGDDFIMYKRAREGGSKLPSVQLIDKTSSSSATSIPALGNQLKRVYVITGVYTAAVSEAFINALKAYPVELITVGQQSVGNSTIAGGIASDDEWTMYIALAYMANKNGEYNYANGIVPNIEAFDVSRDKVTRLRPLGDRRETVLVAVINDITGVRSFYQNAKVSRSLGSSIQTKQWANKSIIELDIK